MVLKGDTRRGFDHSNVAHISTPKPRQLQGFNYRKVLNYRGTPIYGASPGKTQVGAPLAAQSNPPGAPLETQSKPPGAPLETRG